MELSAGASMWLPCEVWPGPFSDERGVLVVGDDGDEWGGFVNTRWLKKKTLKGKDEVLARVVDVDGPVFRARIPGDALQSRLFQGRVDRAVPGDPVQA